MPLKTAGWSGAVYAAAAAAAAPALRLMLGRRVARGKEDAARLGERFGRAGVARPPGRLLWLHAASVGEAMSALPLLAALPDRLSVLFTTGTRTSATLLAQRLAEAPPGCRVIHQFVPLDVPAWAARFLEHWRPDGAAFLESELWPNLLAACQARGVPVALVNARLSAASAAGWARAPRLARAVLSAFAWVSAQSEADAARLRMLGARQVDAPGNLKASAPPLPADPDELARLLAVLGARKRWLVASTHPADDAMVQAAHAALAARHPGLLTAVVPRHPERGAEVAARLGAGRRALGDDPPACGLWVADTLGELGLMYRCFPVVAMGKSFAGGGGQNPWEPAQLGCAVVCGPAMENFRDVVARLGGAGALWQVDDEAGLVAWVDSMLSHPDRLRAASEAACRATRESGDLPGLLAARLATLVEHP